MSQSLIEWSEQYFKHRDIIEKKLKNINKKDNSLILEYKDDKKIALIKPVLDKELFANLKELKDYAKKYVITSLSETNIDFLIANWKLFLIKDMILMFADIKSNNKVLLNPYVHNMISDPDNIEKAVRTLFEQK